MSKKKVIFACQNLETMESDATFDARALKERFNPEGSPLRRMQLRMLEMVALLDRVCRKYGLRWYADNGTLLGCIDTFQTYLQMV